MHEHMRTTLLLTMLTGCGTPSGSEGGSSDTGDPGTSGPASMTSSPTSSPTIEPASTSGVDSSTGGPGSSSSTTGGSGSSGGDCSVDMCPEDLCPEECTPQIECFDFIIQCSCDCPNDCDMEQTACELADLSKVPAIDCGVATLGDNLATWQAVESCVLEHAAGMEAFKAVFDLQGIDSFPRDAFVGQVGVAYSMSLLRQDLGGIPGVTTIWHDNCSDLVPLAGCTTEVGLHCIECVDATGLVPICGP